MDANGTRYHLLLDYDDWAACLDERDDQPGDPLASTWLASPVQHNTSGLEWRAANHELTLQSRVFQFATSPFDDKLNLDRRRGAARDIYGNWYWIAESGVELRVQSAGTGRSAHYWAAGDGGCETPQRFGAFGPKATPPLASGPLPLSGLAITEDHYLVVGVLEPKGLLIFDLHATGAPRQMLWPATVDFIPFDMAPRPGGGVWILDRKNKCYWGLDRKFNVLRLDQATETLTTADFQPVDESETRRTAARPFPEAITLEAASPLNALDPVAIEALLDGSVLILDNLHATPDGAVSLADEKFSRLLRYRWQEALGGASLDAVLDVVDAEAQSSFRLIGYDLAFVRQPDNPPQLGRVFVAAFNGNQTYAFDLLAEAHGLKLQARAEYYPMRLFGGKALVTADDHVYYDFGERWLRLIEQKRPRYEPEATLYTFELDGKEPDCVWHRLLLDACLPPNSAVQIWSRAANELEQLPHVAWWPEPKLHQRAEGSELPFAPRPAATDAGTWELLFQRAAGRYLQLKITLSSGDGRSTPRLRAVRAYYPRFSYLEHYLPAVYREDELSASFLERFLANAEGTLTALEDKIANLHIVFDARSAPAEALDWLAGWLGVVLDPAWDERRRRLFIEYALEFFQYRGTVRGLLLALHLALDNCVDESIFTQPLTFGSTRSAVKRKLSAFRLIEKYRTRQTPPVVLGDPTEAEGLRVVTVSQRWEPKQGPEVLHQRWQSETLLATPFPLRDPKNNNSNTWRMFTRAVLGFIPAAEPARDKSAWQAFLWQRYATLNDLNVAYGLSGPGQYASFAQLTLPTALPNSYAPLLDWYEFEGTVLPMRRMAHSFTVMLPTPSRLTEAERQERLDIAQRVIELEKPAHTTFDLKFYWAMFRVGEARLGEDTLIDVDSRRRARNLIPPFIVGRDYLSEGYLAPGHPQNAEDRLVLDRDPLTSDELSRRHI